MRALVLMAWLGLVPLAAAEDKAETNKEADMALHPRVKMETSLGDIVLELDADKAPITVQNFMTYVQAGFYNGTIFHRVINDFMIQGGGFNAEMQQKSEGLRPGIKNEWKNGLKNLTGTIAMARLGNQPDSATAQFFINVKDNAALDTPRDGAAYAVFGKVVEGMDVVNKIKAVETKPHPKNPAAGQNAPVETVLIKSVTAVGTYDGAKVAERAAGIEKEAQAAEAKAGAAKGDRAKAFQDTLANGKDADGKAVETTASGLKSIVLKPGTGAIPQPTDRVEVHYTGWLMDGTQFDSSVDRGQPAKFGLNQVIKGWTEGVGLMKVGEKRRFFIPYELAYGEAGRPPTIPAKAMLVFDVELLGVNN